MAKKKKTQLKPVVRGFATTSVPKKVIQAEEEAETSSVTGSAEEEAPKAENERKNENDVSIPQSEEFDMDKVEEQSLQNLVDRLQERTERDVSRTVKVY